MARRNTPIQTSFLRDVKEHVMRVRLDRGLHRSLRFQNPRTIHLYFDINTWPGFLSISGDMGDYTFARIPDMFEFFRPPDRDCVYTRRKLPINLGYWHEKLQSQDVRSPAEKWDAAKFKRQLYTYMFTSSWPKAVREEVEADVLCYEGEGQHEFTNAAYSFRTTYKEKRYEFVDLWDHGDAMVFSYQFVWCCYAIVWAIKQYDARRAASPFLYRVPTAVEFAD